MSASRPTQPELTRKAQAILPSEGVPLLIHQPSYSMLNRWIEDALLDTLGELGVGCIAFSPLAQGLLTDKYLNGDTRRMRAPPAPVLSRADFLNEQNLAHVRALNGIAKERGQTLAQMAIAWVLRDSARHLGADRRAHRPPARGFARRRQQPFLQR